MRFSKKRIKRFQRKVFAYYKKHKRNLPWRQTKDPYKILVSEIMLQQTQVSRVLPFYRKWVRKWPTVRKLASASRVSVLKAWQGLGYNSRALRLQQAAKLIAEKYDGNVLRAMRNAKQKIPGVGPYTRNAVLIFASNAPFATMDANIRRVLIHEFELAHTTPQKQLWALAAQCVPARRSREWHNALMDYGALERTARKTKIRSKKQSQFEGSDRQARSRVLRFLLYRKRGSIDALHIVVGEDFPKDRLQRVVDAMVRENILAANAGVYSIR